MASIGDQITGAFIASVPCPRHGDYCSSLGSRWSNVCRARIDNAVVLWHKRLCRERRLNARP